MFLDNGALPLCNPQHRIYIWRTCNFWQKRDWSCAFMVTHSVMKRRSAPLQPPEIMYLCKYRPNRAWNHAYLACIIQNFLRQGAAPWTPVNASHKRSVSSLRSQLFEPPMLKIFLSLCNALSIKVNHFFFFFGKKLTILYSWGYAILFKFHQHVVKILTKYCMHCKKKNKRKNTGIQSAHQLL